MSWTAKGLADVAYENLKHSFYSLLCFLFGLLAAFQAVEASGHELSFITINMMDAEQGWAIIYSTQDDSYRFARTHDGAKTWLDVTPASEDDDQNRYEFFYHFLDESHAWILYSPELWHTQDGGQSWTLMSKIDGFASHYDLNFVDESTGWLLEMDCCAAGNEFAILSLTEDAGASWQVINSDANQVDPPEGINHDLTSAYHSGMAFADATMGWLTLDSIIGFGDILQTQDGGYS